MVGVIWGIVIIIWIVRYVQGRNGNSGPSKANNSPLRVFFFVWLAWYFLTFVPLVLDYRLIPILILCISPLVLFPSAFAQLSIDKGWVKISYWLGYSALFVHRNDPFGGALFYGWRALLHIKPEMREQHKNWLESRLANHKKTLGSGATLMHALLKAENQNNDQVLAQFKFLQGCNKNWIPGNLSRFLFRFLLARACEKKDWEKIGELSRYWQKVGWNPLAMWINLRHWTFDAKKLTLGVRFSILWFYFLSGWPKINKYLPLLRAQVPEKISITYPISLTQLKIQELKAYGHSQDKNLQLNQLWQDYFTEEVKSEWISRIKLLGSFNEEVTYLAIQNSVRDQISLRCGEDDLSSEVAMQERDRKFTLLNIKIRAMNHRTEQKKIMTGIQEYEEFLALVSIADQLGKDTHTRSQVYFQMRSPCWNWVVDLWNKKNNKPLAFLVCSYMAPFANEFGDNDAYNFFHGITSDRFK